MTFEELQKLLEETHATRLEIKVMQVAGKIRFISTAFRAASAFTQAQAYSLVDSMQTLAKGLEHEVKKIKGEI